MSDPAASTRARIERALTQAWPRRGPLAWSLLPLSAPYAAVRAIHRLVYRSGLIKPQSVDVPVIVVGNLYVGGTGKTPLVVELIRGLTARGFTPGVVSRGYGTRRGETRPIDGHARADEAGDEPLLIAQLTGAPIVVGSDRVAAARVLRSLHPNCNLIVCDDGLQHARLQRDFEIVVLNFRGLGNGWLLPAGPLRDSPSRLRGVDAVVLHGEVPAVRIYSPLYRMQTALDEVYALTDPRHRAPLDSLVEEQRRRGTRVVAAAGIANPQRFFDMLAAAGLTFESIALPDHYEFTDNPFAGRAYDVGLITEKDAVKCKSATGMAADGRICAVSLKTTVDPELLDAIVERIEQRHG